MPNVSRRDFLKVASTALATALTPERLLALKHADTNRPNILIILFDACSAKNLSLYGYPRLTSPNIDAFAEHSIVYHQHYSAGNFTSTGTASMLTGMLGWKHRALNYGGLVTSKYIGCNPYSLLGNQYRRLAFSQNTWPDRLIGQYYRDVDHFIPPTGFSLLKDHMWETMFRNDPTVASIATDDFLFETQGDTPPGSSFLGYIYKSRFLREITKYSNKRYPKGIPEVIMRNGYRIPYLNEDVFSGLYGEISELGSGSLPFFAYFHLYSPHAPYRPRHDYQNLFRDDYIPVSKPIHHFSKNLHDDLLLTRRTLYDRQIAQLDDEFGKLMTRLDKDGILNTTYIIVTSDHGEMFERGFAGHGTALMYEPVIRIPLLIHMPGQIKRQDVFAVTSNIDVLPSLLSIAGMDSRSEIDGQILPGLGGEIVDRPIFSIFAIENPSQAPLKKAVISMHKGTHKLIAYFGYEGFDPAFELYDLRNDPEEMDNLADQESSTFLDMKDELLTHLEKANQPFEQN